jgi:hypothetical protein
MPNLPQLPLRRLARRVRDDDRGMTLIELMVGIGMGTLIVLAAFMAMDAASKLSTRTTMRIDAINRGRNATEDITRAIRSQQCVNGVRPMLWASDGAMEFYSSIAPRSTSTFQPTEKHQIRWIANAASEKPLITNGTTPSTQKPLGDIMEYIWRQNPTTGAWPAQPVTKRLAEDVEQAPDRRDKTKLAPFFRYYRYAAATGSGRIDYNDPIDMTAMQNGVASAASTDLSGIVLVEVSFRATPRRTKTASSSAMNFYNTVSVRIADPTNPGGSPQCL